MSNGLVTAIQLDTLPNATADSIDVAIAHTASGSGTDGSRAVIRYVNGINNEEPDAVMAAGRMRAMLMRADIINDSVHVRWVVNPTFSQQWPAVRDSLLARCALKAVSIPPAMSTRYRDRSIAMCKGQVTDGLPGVLAMVSAHDAVEIIRQYVAIRTGIPDVLPGVAIGVANVMRSDIESGRHSLWVAHSQGNMVVAQGVRELKKTRSLLQQGTCTAVVALASPIPSYEFNLDTEYVLGHTTKYDLLRMQLPATDFQTIPNALTARLDAQQIVTPLDQLEAHDVVTNYFSDPQASMIVASTVSEMLTRCREVEP